MVEESPAFGLIGQNPHWLFIEDSQKFLEAVIVNALDFVNLPIHFRILQHEARPIAGTHENAVREITQRLLVEETIEVFLKCDMYCLEGLWFKADVLLKSSSFGGERHLRCEQIFSDFGSQIRMEDRTGIAGI
ncbi:MAG: hypothetical protein Q7R79_00575 [bacterium]|nr:hypothetical protein [bacterium]